MGCRPCGRGWGLIGRRTSSEQSGWGFVSSLLSMMMGLKNLHIRVLQCWGLLHLDP